MEDLRLFLEGKVKQFNNPSFIEKDPISVPHRFSKLQDIEIAALFAAVFAWGNRTTIINKTTELMSLMGNEPHQFCLHHSEEDLRRLLNFKHRTFNPTDLLYFISFLHHHYSLNASLQSAFTKFLSDDDETVQGALINFHDYFFSLEDGPARTRKHIATPLRGSTCKRLLMFLRWMVRDDGQGVDFGIWKKISPAQLVMPVDLHVARVARRFKLLERPSTDWQAAIELTKNLKSFDPLDPVKFDFALFMLGVEERF